MAHSTEGPQYIPDDGGGSVSSQLCTSFMRWGEWLEASQHQHIIDDQGESEHPGMFALDATFKGSGDQINSRISLLTISFDCDHSARIAITSPKNLGASKLRGSTATRGTRGTQNPCLSTKIDLRWMSVARRHSSLYCNTDAHGLIGGSFISIAKIWNLSRSGH